MKVQVLTDRDHVLKRPAMYIGAVNSSSFSEYIFENNKINTVDVIMKSGKYCGVSDNYQNIKIGTNNNFY